MLLFLSSTVKDLEDYRREVRDVCLHKAQTTCLLSEEDWSGGYDDTVEKCKVLVRNSNAFILLMGYWYGSIPPGEERSITHIEFDQALWRWKRNKFPPMAVMTPAPGSLADKKLREAAQNILKDLKIDCKRHDENLSNFHSVVTGSWRRVTSYKDTSDLREFVIARCCEWKGGTPLAAARSEISVETLQNNDVQISDEQLGRLGRSRQFNAVKKTLARMADHASVPALAMMVYGDDDAGQRAFLSRMISTVLKKFYPRSRLTRLPVESGDPAVLSSWIAQSLGIDSRVHIRSPDNLAEQVAHELKQQPLYFILDRIADLVGGAVAFQEQFWLPFYRKLNALRAEQHFNHRLVAVLTEYSGDESRWKTVTCELDQENGTADYTKLLLIPMLETFERTDILEWLEELEVPDEPVGRRSQLANRAMQNSKGQDDPIPSRVFERLRGEVLWPEGGKQ